jgi:hypothetical protein
MSIDTLKTEISRIHREWSVAMQTSLANGATKEYYRVRQRMSILLDLRRQVPYISIYVLYIMTFIFVIFDSISDLSH